jgi:hypothetical protein
MEHLTKAEALRLVHDPLTLHKACERNGLYMPPFTNQICRSKKWLEGVRDGVTWIPKYTEIQQRPCPDPPSKEKVYSAMNRALRKSRKKMDILSIDQLTRPYMLTILSTLEPEHAYFDKSFMPVSTAKASKKFVRNNDGFYTGLPPLRKAAPKRS